MGGSKNDLISYRLTGDFANQGFTKKVEADSPHLPPRIDFFF